jgi:hypothetical protein
VVAWLAAFWPVYAAVASYQRARQNRRMRRLRFRSKIAGEIEA